jgi:RNA polymerase sigma-54 factor
VLTQDLRLKAEKNPLLIYEKKDTMDSIEAIHEEAQAQHEKNIERETERTAEDEREDFNQQADAAQKHDRMIASYSAPKTLAEHLEEQILSQFEPSIERDFILFLAGSVDEKGYLSTPQDELIDVYRQMIGPGKTTTITQALITAVKHLQSLDPVGVGARSLEECLALQVRADPTYSEDRNLRLKLCNHLHHLLTDTPEQLAKRLQCSVAELQAARHYLSTLNPTPGYAFAPPKQLEPPDILATQDANGHWVATCDDTLLPIFTLNEDLLKSIKKSTLSTDEKSQLIAFEQEARLLVNAFHNRNTTLCFIAQAIFDRQQDFLSSAGNPISLKPLHQKDIALALNFDESTISRAVNGKYIRLPHRSKPLPLKACFSKSTLVHTTSNGIDSISDQQVKGTLRSLIAKEDPKHPLSDQAIANHLQKKGLQIARRTIAKYRDLLGIPSTRERRQRSNNL